MRDAEPWEAVVLKDFASTVDGGSVGDTPDHGGDTNVRHDDSASLCLGEEDGVG